MIRVKQMSYGMKKQKAATSNSGKARFLGSYRVQLGLMLLFLVTGLYLASFNNLLAVFGSSGSEDNKPPDITFKMIAVDQIILGVADDSDVSVRYDILSPEDYVSPVHGPCQRARYDLFHSSPFSAYIFRITDANLGKYLCVQAIDNSPARNTAYGHYRLHTHQPAIEKASHFGHGYAHVRQAFERGFKLDIAHYQPSGGHLDVRLSGFPHDWKELRGVNYTDVPSWEDCDEDVFLAEGSDTGAISGYQLADRDVSGLDELDISLPIFENANENYLCIRVALHANDLVDLLPSQYESTKLFVTSQTIGSLLADAWFWLQYEELEVRHTDYDGAIHHVYGNIDTLFSLHAAPSSRFNDQAGAVSMSLNLPGKIRRGGGNNDIQGFLVERVRYAYVESAAACDKDTFKRLRPTLANRFDENRDRYYAYNGHSYDLSFTVDNDRNGEYLCIEVSIKGDVSASFDHHPSKIFVYEIDLP
ncbi:hypothetical protein F4X86_01410 [Candidatus Saccharibacteria bacterium]|nr:hypothetical protein [Candidatus Saccharibacteria bacterium]